MKKISQLTELTTPAEDDELAIVDKNTSTSKRIKVKNLVGIPDLGWTSAADTFAYSAWDSTYKIGTITVSSDATTKYSLGMRIKITQSTGGTKYGIIVAITSTTLKVYFGTDYTLNNEAITDPFYTGLKAPIGFPLNPAKWTVSVTDSTDRSQGSPTNDVWYNLGSLSINIPIGAWDVSFKVALFANRASAATQPIYATLSTANNSESDPEMTNGAEVVATGVGMPVYVRKDVILTSNTPHYLNSKVTATSTSTLYNFNGRARPFIKAVCKYL
jgi:hypothetical protein